MRKKTAMWKKVASMLAAVMCIGVMPGFVACGGDDSSGGNPSGGDNKGKVIYTLSEAGDSYIVTGVSDTKMKEIIVSESYEGKPVTEIGKDAFKNCAKAEKIVIPNSVTEIAKGALRGCGALSYLSIPFTGAKVNAAPEKSPFGYIFGQSEYTDSIAVQQSYGEMEEDNDTYYIPFGLTEVEFTGSKIVYGAFSNCNMISSFTVAPLVISIEENAFLNNNLSYVYVESNLISSKLLGINECGGLLSNVPGVCIKDDVSRTSGYVKGMDSKDNWTHNGKNYSIYANKKFYRFEAEQSVLKGGLGTANEPFGANGVPTGGGAYVNGFFPAGGTGQCEMVFNITSSKATTVSFIYCCGSRSSSFNKCYRLILNGTVITPEKDTSLALAPGVHYLWTQWERYEIMTFELKAGENEFVMHFLPNGQETAESFGNDMNVDYIEFETDAILTWTK